MLSFVRDAMVVVSLHNNNTILEPRKGNTRRCKGHLSIAVETHIPESQASELFAAPRPGGESEDIE